MSEEGKEGNNPAVLAEEDFTEDEVVSAGKETHVFQSYATNPIDEKREGVRGFLAQAVFWLLVTILMILVFLYAFKDKPISEIKEISLLILTPIIGIVGTVFGFYFGSSK